MEYGSTKDLNQLKGHHGADNETNWNVLNIHNNDGIIPVKLPWIFRVAPLKFSETPTNIQHRGMAASSRFCTFCDTGK